MENKGFLAWSSLVIFLLILNGCASSTYSPPVELQTQFTQVGGEYDFITHLTEVNKKLAFSGAVFPKSVVFYDGKEYGGNYLGGMVPMEINGKLAYMALIEDENGQREIIIYEGVEVSKFYDVVSRPVEINGKLSYLARKGSEFYLVIGTEATRLPHKVNYLLNTADLTEVNSEPAYLAEESLRKHYVVYESKSLGTEYASVVQLVAVGGQLAYIAHEDGEWFAVHKGNELGRDKHYDSAEFLLDVGGQPAFYAEREGKGYIWYQGEEYGENYERISIPWDVGGKLAFTGTRMDDEEVLVVGDEEINEYLDSRFPVDVNGKLAYAAYACEDDSDYSTCEAVIIKEGKIVVKDNGIMADSLTVINGKLAYISHTGLKGAVFIEK